MPSALRCRTCSAPLDLPPEHATTARCPYCGAGVLLTERGGSVQAAAQQDPHADAIAEVLRQLRAGSKIGAIRIYRERFGVGLAEAKDAVERIEAGQPAGSLRASPTGNPKAALGCALLLLLAAGAGGVFMLRGSTSDDAAPPAQAAPVAGAPKPAVAEEPAGPPAFAEPVLRFGSEGTGAGRFDDARSVAVDGAGRIYVAEYSGGRVQVFDSAGTFLTQWMADTRMPLVDMAADRGGTVYIVQSGRIRRFEGATGRALGEMSRARLFGYKDVTVALDGTLWAVSENAVVHLGRAGAVQRTIDLKQAVDEDASPARVAVSGTGDLYVLDEWNASVYHLNPGGRFVDRFGGKGEGLGNLRSPEDVAVDGRGRVYVSDLGTAIHVFDAAGQPVATFGGSSVVFGIAITAADDIFAAHRNDNQVIKYRITP
jgi:streptogramin lyase/DNA-directed RNA polymerase subunit RPC12/RpoP